MKTALNTSNTFSLKTVFFDFKEITKAGLAISVLFLSIAGLFFGFMIDILSMVCVDNACYWGYCMVGASNALIKIEKDLDALMDN
jgi:protoheme IX farnesyltransferase